MNLQELRTRLNAPPAEDRSAAFWSWNGHLEQQELNEQLDGFCAQGLGGFFMHSREGLETPYLSEEWMDHIRKSAAYGKQHGLLPYIYDEDKWPSGMAGGKIAAIHPEFRATAITLCTDHVNCQYQYCAELDGHTLLSLRNGNEPTGKEVRIGIAVEQSGTSDWYSGSAPSDNLNPQSIQEFLRLTHEAYRRSFGGSLTGKIEGFFTDEPNFCDFFASFTKDRPWLPWTACFADYFSAQRGYDICPYLPYLFYEGSHSAKTRHDYWRTLTELFQQSYFQQLFDWCEKNHVKSCGHLLFENGLGYQARVCGAAMPHYKYFHVPGIDILSERTEEYLTVKQCTSVANQYRRPAISETYGCSGWQFTFEGQKWVWDWQAVMGISIRCQHLAQYSIKGLRKRDYPPFFNYQSVWWKYDHVMENYCARVSACVKAGEVVRPILVLHPQSSVWCQCGSRDDEDLSHFDGNMGWTDPHITGINKEYDAVNRFARALLLRQCDFDFGDELLLAQDGCVRDGQLFAARAGYQLVIVPCCENLFSTTLHLLRRFSDQGGRIVWVGTLPGLVDGEKNMLAAELFPNAEIVPDEKAALEIAEHYRSVTAVDCKTLQTAPILTSFRKVDDGYVVIAVNNDRSKDIMCKLHIPVCGAATEYDPLTGECRQIPVDTQMGLLAAFGPADLKIYLIDPQKKPAYAALEMPYHDVHETPATIACLGPTAKFSRTLPNVLTIDRCRYRVEDGWSEEAYLWEIQRDIRAKADFRQIFGNGQPMRYTWLTEEKKSVPIAIKVNFSVCQLPQTPLIFAMEDASHFMLSCNGTVCEHWNGFYLDKSITGFVLQNVQLGENTLILECSAYTQAMELEDMYLLGDFALDQNYALISEPKTLRFGDWCLQGYPNYAGSIHYYFRFESDRTQARLHMGAFAATLLVIRVNGGKAQFLPWRAANDLPLQLHIGENEIDIEVVGSNRNVFGPLHQPNTRSSRIDWRDFRTEGASCSADLTLEPYGIMQEVYIVP